MDLSNILLVSDIDGTLMTADYSIPLKNLEAIEKFMANNGQFAIATGRSPGSAISSIFSKVKTNAPSITLNGGLIWDANSDKIIYGTNLDNSVVEILKEVNNKFPTIGIELFGCKDIYEVSKNDYTTSHLKRSNITPVEVDIYKTIPKEKYKALFLADVQDIDNLVKFLEEKKLSEFRFFKSSPNYLELVPKNVDKGRALEKLAQILGVCASNTFAIGDYYNDLELLHSASVSAAPNNAIDDIKNIVNIVVCDCKDGAVAEFINWIIENKAN